MVLFRRSQHRDFKPDLYGFRPKHKIHDELYWHFFKTHLFIEKYLSIAVIGVRDGKQISITDFMTVKIPYPSFEELNQIAFVLNTALEEIDLMKKEVEAYSRQRLGLMQKLLTLPIGNRDTMDEL